jgi:excisionase family DNA binding protein
MAHVLIPKIPLAERKTFTLGEVAGLTGLSVGTLYNLMSDGRLKTIKIAGRRLVAREALDALVGTPRESIAAKCRKKVRRRRRSAARDRYAGTEKVIRRSRG